MAVCAKTGTARLDHQAGPPKTTRQGYGQRSRPRRQLRHLAAAAGLTVAELKELFGLE